MSRERVEKWQGISIGWPRPPRSLAGAINRIESLRQAIHWMKGDLENAEWSRDQYARDIRHLENILHKRWEANDGRLTRFSCDCGSRTCVPFYEGILSQLTTGPVQLTTGPVRADAEVAGDVLAVIGDYDRDGLDAFRKRREP